MQFSIATLFAVMAAIAVAQPVAPPSNVLNRRQAVSAEVASMTDADGNVIAYDTAGVKFPMKDAGN